MNRLAHHRVAGDLYDPITTLVDSTGNSNQYWRAPRPLPMPAVECDPKEARSRLERAGIAIEAGNTEHERWRASTESATAVAYDDKVVVQGIAPHELLGLLREEAGRAAVYFDGASRGNPGPSAIGWVIRADDRIVDERGQGIGYGTNNQAEYRALIAALEAARSYGVDEVIVHGDSELIIKQLRGEYDVNDPTLRELRVQAHELLQAFDAWELRHVPRTVNDRADRLAAEALDD